MNARRTVLAAAAAAIAAVVAAPGADAQKAKDTVRIAITEPVRLIEPYTYPVTEASFFSRQVYQSLIAYDEHKGELVPVLAKSWKRIDPKTIEFELRDDVKFHNGNKFDADDVVATIAYVGDPKVKFAFKGRYTWIEKVEKLGPHRIRIHAKAPRSTDLLELAYRFWMLDAETHNALPDKTVYGRVSPYGTGPYKITQVDANDGVVAERFEGFSGPHYRAPIKRVVGKPIPDQQTQIAQLLVGEIDVIRNPTEDNANALKGNPDLKITSVDSMTISYLLLDAANRSGRKELSDPRVREAIWKAIDREKIVRTLVAGGDVATIPDVMCFAGMQGCAGSTAPDAYDPVRAKALLAEAGYPDGFEMLLTAHVSERAQAEAISGYLREIGIRAKVEPVNLTVMRKKRGDGDFEGYVGYYPNGSLPDVSNALNVYFGAKSRDYARDPRLGELIKAGLATQDIDKRRAAYKEAFDLVNQKRYVLPLSSLPIVWAHSKDVRLEPGLLSQNDVFISDFVWN